MSNISVIQQEAIANIFKQDVRSRREVVKPPEIFGVFAKHAPLLGEALPEVCKSLESFMATADLAHPDISEIITKEDSDLISQYLTLFSFAHRENLNAVLPLIKKLVFKAVVNDPKKLHSTVLNSARFIADPEKRATTRRTRRSFRSIRIRNLDQNSWEIEKRDLALFVRLNNALEGEIAKANEKAAKFARLGLSEIQKDVLGSIENFKKDMECDYYGFHRLSMRRMAVLLAKLHSMEFVDKKDGHILPNIQFPKALLNGHEFTDAGRKPLMYHPCAFPLWQLWDKASDKIKEVISHLDAFPEAGGRPIFDHFVVVVPGTEPPKNAVGFTYKNTASTSQSFPENLFRLNYSLAVNRCVSSAVMGEKDGRCYFICFF